jgi:hypothetical protein
MREIFKSGSVGRAPGNRCFYPEARRRGNGISCWMHITILAADRCVVLRFVI